MVRSQCVTEGTGCRLNAMICSSIGTFNEGTSEAESLFRVQATAICGSGYRKFSANKRFGLGSNNKNEKTDLLSLDMDDEYGERLS